MKSDEDREGLLVPGTSNMSPEEKMVDTGSSSYDIIRDVSPYPEIWRNADIKPSQEASRKKLCGYLYKCSSKAPIKTWKSRWFCYDENKCYLLYYRTAQDINPLGSIEISIASFDPKVGADEGTFEIRTPIKDFILKVCNCRKIGWVGGCGLNWDRSPNYINNVSILRDIFNKVAKQRIQ